MSLCQNRSTRLNRYCEPGYFELNTTETCQHESVELINRVNENQPVLA